MKYYVIAPQGGGLHFFTHLARKHMFGSDSSTIACDYCNEYNASEQVGNIDNMRFVWNPDTKMWNMRAEAIEDDPIIRIHPDQYHEWYDGKSEGFLVYAGNVNTRILHSKLVLIKRSFATGMRVHKKKLNHLMGSDTVDIDKWRGFVRWISSLDIPVWPTSEACLQYFSENDHYDYDRFILHLQRFYTLGLDNLVKQAANIVNEENKVVSSLSPNIVPINYTDLMIGKPSTTFLDNYREDIDRYHQKNEEVIKKYESFLL